MGSTSKCSNLRVDDEALQDLTRIDDCALHDVFYSDVVCEVAVHDHPEVSSSNTSARMHDKTRREDDWTLPPRADRMIELTAMHRF